MRKQFVAGTPELITGHVNRRRVNIMGIQTLHECEYLMNLCHML